MEFPQRGVANGMCPETATQHFGIGSKDPATCPARDLECPHPFLVTLSHDKHNNAQSQGEDDDGTEDGEEQGLEL